MDGTSGPPAPGGLPKGGTDKKKVTIATGPEMGPSPFTSPSLPAGGGGGGDGDAPPPSILRRPQVLRSASSLSQRVSGTLDRALSHHERPDGATEARTLLPGVDLRAHLGLVEEGSDDDDDNSAGKIWF